MDELAKELTAELLEEEQWREMAEVIGADNFYRLAKHLGGQTIYVPKPESLLRPVRDQHIKEEFNGWNHVELARKYGVTDRWVRALCGPGFLEGQIGIFDEPAGSDSKK